MITTFTPAPPRKKYPRSTALDVAREICAAVKDDCERLVVTGSLRRRKSEVGDVEIVYIPKFVPGVRNDFFSEPTLSDCVECKLEYLMHAGVIQRRLNKEGRETWGPKNKLAVHVATGMPIDFFLTMEPAWWNYLVCRTGSAENNVKISTAAERKNWKWHPYAAGFTDEAGTLRPVRSEREVFELVGLEYLEPWER